MAGKTICHRLVNWAAESPQTTAFEFCADGESVTESITYAELVSQAAQLANELRTTSAVGDRALLLLPTSIDYVVALVGCWIAGLVAVPVFPPHRNRNAERVQGIAADAEPSVILTSSEAAEGVESLVPARCGKPSIVALDKLNRGTGPAVVELASLHDLAILQYTSGSTGDPKGVRISHANLLANASTIADAFVLRHGLRSVSWLPLYHDMGLVGGVVAPLYSGVTTTLMPSNAFLQQPLRWLKLISQTGAEIAGGPNFAYDLCVNRTTPRERAQLDLSQWRLAFNGAEPVRGNTLESFSKTFAPCGFRPQAFYPCYGMAEATLLVTGGDPERLPRKSRVIDSGTQVVSCGRPRGVELAIVDSAAEVIASDGDVGEIWLSGPAISSGYWNRPHDSAFAGQLAGDSRRWLRTGDLGFMSRGELFVTGRAKDVIIIRGVNFFAHDIEQTSRRAHPALESAPAAALAVPVAGVESLVVVQESPRRYLQDAEQVITAIRMSITNTHGIAPAAVVLVKPGQLSRTTSGKIQRFACRQRYLGHQMLALLEWKADSTARSGPSASAMPQSTLASLVELIGRSVAVAGHEITADANLASLGLDSLQAMELLSAVETRFGVLIEESDFVACESLAAFAELIDKATEQQPRPATGIEPGDWQFEQSPEYRRLLDALQLPQRAGVANPYFAAHDGIAADRTRIAGRELINYCSYNYLGMNGRRTVQQAAQSAIDRYGTSVSASRLVAGERPLHRELELAIASLVGTDDAITFVGGHSTNETVIGHMFAAGDLILHDELAHNSIVQGCRLSGATRRAFPHNDVAACGELLAQLRGRFRRVLIAVEGVYSMDGDIAPLPQFVELKQQHKAYLMVDEAHSLGTIGRTGRGIGEHFGIDPRQVDLWMGTLSKSLGSCGGYIAASRAIVQYLKYTAPGFVYSVGLSPPNAAAALSAIEELRKSRGNVMLLQANARHFLEGARRLGLNTGSSHGTPIVPVITGDSLAALHLSDRLLRAGINVQPILSPAVENHAARLRFFITSLHSREQIDHTLAQLAQCIGDLPRSTAA
jgi:8-amino-7-oxononanoate synthase